jgi:hypothetical protein
MHIEEMESLLASPSPSHQRFSDGQPSVIAEAMRHADSHMQNMCKYEVSELTDDVFLEKWSNKEPFILRGITHSTSPQDLLDLKNNRLKRCTTTFYDGQVWQTKKSTLGTYFKCWEKDQSPDKSLQIWVHLNVYLISSAHVSVGLPAWR